MLEFNNILQILPIRSSIPSVMFMLCGEVIGAIERVALFKRPFWLAYFVSPCDAPHPSNCYGLCDVAERASANMAPSPWIYWHLQL